jgi:hypothetical protein
MGDIQTLKALLREYRNADDQLHELNKQVYAIRDTRKAAESQITELLAKPEFATFDKLKLEDDGSTIRIQRPSQWAKPWSLSKNSLMQYLTQYFRSNTDFQSAESCFEYIETQQKRQLVATEFNLTRVLPKESDK